VKISLSDEITELLCLMPLVKQNLHVRLQKSFQSKVPIEESEILKLLSDIGCGLSRLHHCTTPIIHRDLKVENILYDGSDYLICDFGSATAKVWDPKVHSVTAISEDLEKYTTLAYRAPEMVDLYSDRGPLNTKTDMWAIGVLAYKVSTVYVAKGFFYTSCHGDDFLNE
jgi:AP2-associated kinase